MTLRTLLLAIILGLGPVALALRVAAETPGDPQLVQNTVDIRIAALSDTMMMGQVMAVMREEGLVYGRTLEDEMFSGRGGARWQAIVALIYDADQMRHRFDVALSRELGAAGDDLGQIEEFFRSEQGQRFLKLEIDARRALLDQAAEDAAKVAWADMAADDTTRSQLIRRFAEVNDLIESNVMGALNSNLAFYRGLAAAGSFPDEMTEEQMLSDVWGQESQIRSETENWLFPFLALAYQPLSDEDIEAYTAFSDSAAGKRMNAALFVAFDDVFTQISEELGKAAALQMQGEDI